MNMQLSKKKKKQNINTDLIDSVQGSLRCSTEKCVCPWPEELTTQIVTHATFNRKIV